MESIVYYARARSANAFDSNSQLGATNAAGAVVPAAHDSWEYTIMTYHAYAGAPNYIVANRDAGSYAQILMMDDIQAIQYLYGANFTTNSGDTRYSFDPNTGQMFIDGVGQGVPLGDKIFRTIWDGGGNDTYDFSNYTTNMTIDLRPGQWSTLSTTQLADLGQSGGGDLHHAAIGNVANAMLFQGDTRSLIENAIGGSGGDTITGNEANNTIYGGSGDDVIHGGDGNDILSGGFVSRSQATGPDGNDVIYGDAGNDVIKVLWGNDVVHGGADNDTLSFADVRTNLIVDLASGSTTYTEGGSFVDPSGNGGGAFAGLYTVGRHRESHRRLRQRYYYG